ncbi:NAD(P)-binding domain-containing protein [Herbidospora sp. NEAU-GS84]|uniref:NAD(P)-binding domain-containing protein n=1 Tax=Herbidospora solisilvae TaxID=2696284 RepID=A0A7C9NKS7_9ACTN|nr:Glu/Leu/Phe/Val dehydrogenase dimerization domain-containing protein [Herbidospora solisilvae]NAS20876.1 NAD(P)-binding domain-containing protein [Herbidospora solisilvae]
MRTDFEQVVTRHDPVTGLDAVIAVHDTTRGPAIGGVRVLPYRDRAAALDDAMRLARAMTRKTAAAGLRLGGGKSVVIAEAATPELMRAHGRFIRSLEGRYIPGIDVGTGAAEMRQIAAEATVVTCQEGDPSWLTALGAFCGIEAAVAHVHGTSPAGRTVIVQGVGHVGHHLARMLVKAGAKVLVSDVAPGRADALAGEIGATAIDPVTALARECDVLAPCALGGVVDDATVDGLRCGIVAGPANNVLAHDDLADVLAGRGVTFVPDFIMSAGGITFLDEQLAGGDEESAIPRVRAIGPRVAGLLADAAVRGVTPLEAAEDLAAANLKSDVHRTTIEA